ncbi:amastin-like surface protein [Angomonas deanei]|nr:amastin-like surface protein [Angomonas deanei]|eukprot:EPY15661.1 amastin-like surface protein [Angomonas deanei]
MSSYSLYLYDDAETDLPRVCSSAPAPVEEVSPKVVKKAPRQRRIAPVVFCVLQFVILLLCILGVCFDQIRPSEEIQKTVVGCFSYWGIKKPGENCITGKNDYFSTTTALSVCKTRESKIKAGGGCGLTAIVLIFASLLSGCAAVYTGDRVLLFVGVGLNVVAFIFLCVSWAVIAYMFHHADGLKPETVEKGMNWFFHGLDVNIELLCMAFKDLNQLDEGYTYVKYGSGFGLLLASWALLVINSVICLLPF